MDRELADVELEARVRFPALFMAADDAAEAELVKRGELGVREEMAA